MLVWVGGGGKGFSISKAWLRKNEKKPVAYTLLSGSKNPCGVRLKYGELSESESVSVVQPLAKCPWQDLILNKLDRSIPSENSPSLS